MAFFSKLKSGLQQFVPGRELARGLGTALALPEINKLQTESDRREDELRKEIARRIKEARGRGDTESLNRLKKAAGHFGRESVIEAAIADAPTSKQVISSAGELAAFAALGLKLKLPFKSFKPTLPFTKGAVVIKGAKSGLSAVKAAKLAGAGLGKKILVKGVKPLAREAGIGAGLFGLMKGSEKDATTNDIIKAAESGAVFGGGLYGGLAGLGLGIKGAAKVAGPPLKRLFQKAEMGLEKSVAGVKEDVGTQIQKTLSYINEPSGLKVKTSQVLLKGLTEARKMKARLIDRFTPFKRIEDRVAEFYGRPLKESEKVYRDARLLQSVANAEAETKVIQLTEKLKPYKDVRDQSKAWLAQIDFVDRAKLGQKTPGGQSYDELVAGLNKMKDEIGPENMKKVGEVRAIIGDYNQRLLQERLEAGLINQETIDNLLRTHPNYIPHNVIMEVDEKIARGLSQSLNVSKTDIMKAVGSVKNIQDPFVATIERTPIATRVIEKNKLLNNLVGVQEQSGLFPGMKLIKDEAKKSPLGFDNITLFKNGTKQVWQVPEDIAVAIKNLDSPLMPGWFKVVTFPQKILKKFATQLNLSFAIPNKFRDKQTAALTSNAFIKGLSEKYGTTEAIKGLSSKEIKELYTKSGGYGASIFREGEDVIWNKLNKTGTAKKLQWANPVKIIDEINSSIETSTRMNVFKKALAKGLSPKDAALVSRDASIDFAKMGTWMKPLNQAIPFLNARVQGFVNLPRAIASNPEAFARMQMYTAAYPTLLLHQHNRRFDSYKNVSQYFKNKYWIVMIGETDSIDNYTGQPIKVPQFVTLPKGEGQTLVSGPIQHYLEKSDGVDYRKTSEMIADVVGSASPMEFQSFDQGNAWLSLAGQFGPGVSIPVGLASNKQPYFGSSIVPEKRINAPKEQQFKSTTPETTKELANLMNVSPAKLEFILDSFGGLTQDMQSAADIVYNVVRGDGIGGNPITDTPIGAATQIPISKRFIREGREFYGPEMEFRQEQKREIETDITGQKLKVEDKATEIWEGLNKRKTKEERLNYLNSLGDELTPEIRDKISNWKKSRQTVEVLKKTDSVELRARYIFQRLNEIKIKEDRIKFLESLGDSKILTDKVRKRIGELKN